MFLLICFFLLTFNLNFFCVKRSETEPSTSSIKFLLICPFDDMIEAINKNHQWSIEKKIDFVNNQKKKCFRAIKIANDFLEFTFHKNKIKPFFNNLNVVEIEFFKAILEKFSQLIGHDSGSLNIIDQLSIFSGFIKNVSDDLINFKSRYPGNPYKINIVMEKIFPLTYEQTIAFLKYRFHLFLLYSQLMIEFSKEDNLENLLKITNSLEQKLETNLQYENVTVFLNESEARERTIYQLQNYFCMPFDFDLNCFFLEFEDSCTRSEKLKKTQRKIASIFLYKLIKNKMYSKNVSLNEWNKYTYFDITFQFFEPHKSPECSNLIQSLTELSHFLATGNRNYLPEENITDLDEKIDNPNILCKEIIQKYKFSLEVLKTLEAILSNFLDSKFYDCKYFTELNILKNTKELITLLKRAIKKSK